MTIYRPSWGSWYVLSSSQSYASGPIVQWGQSGDIPVAADDNGDGKADFAFLIAPPQAGGGSPGLALTAGALPEYIPV